MTIRPAYALSVILAVSVMIGCGQAVPQTQSQPGEEHEILHLAVEKAKAEGIDPDLYNKVIKYTQDAWWVFFDKKKPEPELGWPNHFSIRISHGQAQLFRGR